MNVLFQSMSVDFGGLVLIPQKRLLDGQWPKRSCLAIKREGQGEKRIKSVKMAHFCWNDLPYLLLFKVFC